MATRNIQMNYYNGTNYDVLYPQSTIAQISNLQSSLNSKLNLSGGTMTGNLTLRGDPTTNLMAATKQYVDNMKTTIQNDIFFDKLLEKEFIINLAFDGSSRHPSSGVVTTELESEIKNILPISLFLISEWNLNITSNKGAIFNFGFTDNYDSMEYGLYNSYNYRSGTSTTENILISTFNSFSCYNAGNKFSYINNENITLSIDEFNYISADNYDGSLNGTITGTLKITFYGIN